MNTGTRSKHFHGKQHEKKYNRIKQIEIEIERERLKDLEVRVFVSGTFETRIARLGLQKWRESLRASLYRYIRGDALAKTDATMQKYEKMERLSLLELAILKSKAEDGVFFRDLNEIREQQALDPKFCASAYLKDKRVLCGCEVIVPAVAKFL